MLRKYIGDYNFFSHFYYIALAQVIIFYILSINKQEFFFCKYIYILSIIKILGQYIYFISFKNLSAISLCIFEQTKYFYITAGSIFFLDEKYKKYQYFAILVLIFAPLIQISDFKTFSLYDIFIGFFSVFCRCAFEIFLYYFRKKNRNKNVCKIFFMIYLLVFYISFFTFINMFIYKSTDMLISLKHPYHYLASCCLLLKEFYCNFASLKLSAMNLTIIGSLVQIIASIIFSLVVENTLKIGNIITISITIIGVLIFNYTYIKHFINKNICRTEYITEE
ncbi:hypothetical protein SLOPH_895 [Spraguea lophii 42_110]|uniref:Nucleotide-sugar transporter n=1 Tax=Spraguea lophii (strain 42_110) TaxID=1358809 RepID=S7XJ84_SPRLO|nr:hypothetical protein SLOPH_895 [Spraguea lophii 42_110]